MRSGIKQNEIHEGKGRGRSKPRRVLQQDKLAKATNLALRCTPFSVPGAQRVLFIDQLCTSTTSTRAGGNFRSSLETQFRPPSPQPTRPTYIRGYTIASPVCGGVVSPYIKARPLKVPRPTSKVFPLFAKTSLSSMVVYLQQCRAAM